MARKALEKDIQAPVELTPEAAEAINQVQQTGAAIIQVAHGDHEQAAKAIHMRAGRRQMSALFQKLVTVSDLVDLQNIKESKSYKGFQHQTDDGKFVTITTWAEYCAEIEGRPHVTIDLDLKNLTVLGPELFETMRTVGIGPSTMRAIRQLPEEQQALIQQAVDTTNKDDLAEFIEQILVKKAKKEEQLTLQLNEAQAELEAKDEVAASNQKRINQLQEKAALLKKLSPDEKAKQLCSEIAAQQTGIDEEIRTNFFTALQALIDHGGDDHQAFINAQIQMLHDAVKLLRDEFGGQGVEWEQEAE
jgi:hypothetical protein